MQRARSSHPHGHRVRIATFVVAFLTAGAMPLVSMPASAATLDRVKQTGQFSQVESEHFSVRTLWLDYRTSCPGGHAPGRIGVVTLLMS